MRVAIRVDASARIGTGHVRRCLSLADALRRAGAEVAFVTRDLGADAGAMIAAQGFHFALLPAPRPDAANDLHAASVPHAAWAQVPQALDAEQTCAALAGYRPRWMLVDHYAFDALWHAQAARCLDARIAVIDDLADRSLDCELLVDHNLSADHRAKYAEVLPRTTRILGGPRFALLAPAYRAVPRYRFSETVSSIGIFMGGGDFGDFTSLALRACREQAGFSGPVEVVTTRANPHLERLRALAARDPGVTLQLDLPDLAAFYARHDLHIGAGGGAAWERCCIGVPAIVLVCADNQQDVVAGLVGAGLAVRPDAQDAPSLGRAVAELVVDASRRRALHERCLGIVDGRGAERVALAMVRDAISLRAAVPGDGAGIFQWRNDERTRRYFRDQRELGLEEHLRWWSTVLADPARDLLIARCGQIDVGVVRFDRDGARAEISVYLDPGLAGFGLGVAVIESAIRWALERTTIEHFDAEVLPANTASAAAFARAGFSSSDGTHWRRYRS
jgi:UDP-2,4-diacetamido-2,4,6-trideoxy-beta-L-altropyranose hydrolase